jgi:cytochrome b
LVTCFFIAWATGDEIRWLHMRVGYIIIALVLCRIAWGFVGSRHARFTDFVPGPRRFISYCRDLLRFRARRYLGHNPAGGAMIVALLFMLTVTAGSGYLMTTDAFWGVEWVENLHKAAVNMMIGLVGLHVAGVVLSGLAHRENLIRAMITGRKRLDPDEA